MSIDKPRNRLSGGARISALATSAMAKTATASRSRREILTMARRLMPALHADQAADKRRIARLGVGIDLEHDLLVREFGPVDTAGSERHASLGKIQECAAHELSLGDRNLAAFARLIQAFDDELAGRPHFEHRR